MFDQRYAALRAAQTAKADEGETFDDHVFACVLSAALADQAAADLALTEGLGLTRAEAVALSSWHCRRIPWRTYLTARRTAETRRTRRSRVG